ncbi:MAG: hypothetical protein Q8O83_02195 [bacterium]|nr:hypothetical protein [bacterium]
MGNKENILATIVFCIFCIGCEIIEPIEPFESDPHYTYETLHGMRAILENIDENPDQITVETWTSELLAFWGNIFDSSVIDCMMNNELSIIQVAFTDADYVVCSNAIDKCGGIAFPSKHMFKVSNGAEYKVYITFIHELSHLLLNCVRDPNKYVIDHDLFFVIGLEDFFKRKYVDDRITH